MNKYLAYFKQIENNIISLLFDSKRWNNCDNYIYTNVGDYSIRLLSCASIYNVYVVKCINRHTCQHSNSFTENSSSAYYAFDLLTNINYNGNLAIALSEPRYNISNIDSNTLNPFIQLYLTETIDYYENNVNTSLSENKEIALQNTISENASISVYTQNQIVYPAQKIISAKKPIIEPIIDKYETQFKPPKEIIQFYNNIEHIEESNDIDEYDSPNIIFSKNTCGDKFVEYIQNYIATHAPEYYDNLIWLSNFITTYTNITADYIISLSIQSDNIDIRFIDSNEESIHVRFSYNTEFSYQKLIFDINYQNGIDTVSILKNYIAIIPLKYKHFYNL